MPENATESNFKVILKQFSSLDDVDNRITGRMIVIAKLGPMFDITAALFLEGKEEDLLEDLKQETLMEFKLFQQYYREARDKIDRIKERGSVGDTEFRDVSGIINVALSTSVGLNSLLEKLFLKGMNF